MADKKKFIQVESITAGITLLTACYVFFKCRHTSTSADKKQLTGSGQEQHQSCEQKDKDMSGGKQSTLSNTHPNNSNVARTEKETMGRVNDYVIIPLLIGIAGSLVGGIIMLFFGDIFKSDLPYVKEIGVLELILFIILMIYWGISITCCGKVENAERKLFWFFVLAMTVLFGGVFLSIYKKSVISTNNTPTVDTPIIHVKASVSVLVKDDSVKAVIPIDSLHYVNVKQYLQSSKSLSPKQEANTDSLHKKQNQKQK